jgi:protein-S-isoprenylcysteine O-methyltransferase Ste14
MDVYLTLSAIAALTYVCLLPFVFFRKDGTFNLAWLATASPYVCYLILLALGLAEVIKPWQWPNTIVDAAEVMGFVCVIFSIVLISLTIGSHRVPLALWHQNNDAPVNIVKHGPYARIRHPFYSSFILILCGSFLIFPYWISAAISVYGITALNLTAHKEERKLSSSEFAEEYQNYMKQTGRFFPKL